MSDQRHEQECEICGTSCGLMSNAAFREMGRTCGRDECAGQLHEARGMDASDERNNLIEEEPPCQT